MHVYRIAASSKGRIVTVEQIRTAYSAEPFHPFSLHLADGREIQVPHRDFLYLFPSGRTILVSQPDESWNVIDLLLVTDLEFKPLRNGGRKRSR